MGSSMTPPDTSAKSTATPPQPLQRVAACCSVLQRVARRIFSPDNRNTLTIRAFAIDGAQRL